MSGDPYRTLYRDEFSADHYDLVPWVDRPEDDVWDTWLWTTFVFRYDGDTPIEYVGCDGGEPEDQTLSRDWAWVVGALNKEARRER